MSLCRWQDAADRKAREEEAAAAETLAAERAALTAARQSQAAAKVLAQAAQAKLEAAQFEATLSRTRAMQREQEEQAETHPFFLMPNEL